MYFLLFAEHNIPLLFFAVNAAKSQKLWIRKRPQEKDGISTENTQRGNWTTTGRKTSYQVTYPHPLPTLGHQSQNQRSETSDRFFVLCLEGGGRWTLWESPVFHPKFGKNREIKKNLVGRGHLEFWCHWKWTIQFEYTLRSMTGRFSQVCLSTGEGVPAGLWCRVHSEGRGYPGL